MIYLYTGIGVFLVVRMRLACKHKRKIKHKGLEGERFVHEILVRLPKRRYKVLSNVLLRMNHGTTQIDHIVVSRYGIFVIETKNYKGTIAGNEYSEYWTQYLSGNSYTFYNPVKQNKVHIHAIHQFVKEFEKLPVVSLIAFSEESKLEIFGETEVLHFNALTRAIRMYRRRRISKRNMIRIYEAIIDANLTKKQEHREHVNSVKSNVKTYEKNVKHRICPRCGGKLVKRRKNKKRVLVCKNKKHCNYCYVLR